MRDQISWMGELTDVLNDVADGKASSSEAAAEIKKLGELGEEFMQRKTSLNEGISEDELMAVGTKYREALAEALKQQMQAMNSVARSGRMTAELGEAIENMKSSKSSSAEAIEKAAESLLENMK